MVDGGFPSVIHLEIAWFVFRVSLLENCLNFVFIFWDFLLLIFVTFSVIFVIIL